MSGQGVAVRTLSLVGITGGEICKTANAPEVRLLVIGAHGWGRLDRITHGSVSEDVVQHAHVPVLVVPGDHFTPAETTAEPVGAAAS